MNSVKQKYKWKKGRNSPCPCGSGKKFKNCCQGKVSWDDIITGEPGEFIRHLSARGKNRLFLKIVCEALQLDKIEKPEHWSQIKRACTTEAIGKIYQAVADIWPSADDLTRVLESEQQNSSGLFVGFYDLETILHGLLRHSLYNDSILLIDPFLDPRRFRPEFNPIENPSLFLTTTIEAIHLWFRLSPWIEAGVVKLVRTPGDFDLDLEFACNRIEEQRADNSPELRQLEDETFALFDQSHLVRLFKENVLLHYSNEFFVAQYRERYPQASEQDLATLLNKIERMRKNHPHYMPRNGEGNLSQRELVKFSTGANYEMAKIISAKSGSHLITDIPMRWKEMEIDRKQLGIEQGVWEPFAKAFNKLEWRFLENVPLDAALELRKQGRLESMRSFLQRTWRASSSDEPFGQENIENLTTELDYRIHEAEDEWAEIDRDLIKWFGSEVLVGAYPAIATGDVRWMASVSVAGILNLVFAGHKRRSFLRRYPAGFFLRLLGR